MDPINFEELSLQLEIGESDRLEAKRASKGVGKSCLETISAFCNEPGLGGGYLLLGLEERSEGYRPTGVPNIDELQNELISLCRSAFSIPVQPTVAAYLYQGKRILVALIPEAPPHEKPVYIKALGHTRGAFRRMGASDVLCMREDVDYLLQQASRKPFDQTVLDDARWEDFDPAAIREYRRRRQQINGEASELQLDDREMLVSLQAMVSEGDKWFPTVAGIFLFGSTIALRRLFPIGSRVDYMLVEGTEWVPDPTHRYHSVEFREGLITLIPRLLAQVMQDIPNAFSLDPETMRRKDIPSIPRDVVREAITNALMHRDYSAARTTQLIRYANRLEIRNPGYSLKSLDHFSLPGSMPRNERIAGVLHDLNLAENKGTGIQTMQATMKEANLSVPLIESSRTYNEFTLCLLPHHLFSESDLEWLATFKEANLSSEEARALIVIREMGALTNSDYRMINSVDTLTASGSLRRLRDLGLLVQKGAGAKTYYTPSMGLHAEPDESVAAEVRRDSIRRTLGKMGAKPGKLSEKPSQLKKNPPDLSVNPPDLSVNPPDLSVNPPDLSGLLERFPGLSEALVNEVHACQSRAPIERIRSLIKRLCALGPLSLGELAGLLHRHPDYLRKTLIKPMLKDGELGLLYPKNPHHPNQGYVAPQ